MKISVVTTLYKSSNSINEFYSLMSNEVKKITDDYEIIFVDDGSPDDSFKKCIDFHKNDSKVRIIQLSRNFGHHYAAYAGLKSASGEYIFLIDSDLEVSPNVFTTFYDKIQNSNIDVVYGVQKTRKGDFVEKYIGAIFWNLFNFLSDVKVQKNVLTERLMNRKYLDSLLKLEEKNLFFAGNMYWVGFNQIAIEIKKKQRTEKSTYNFIKRFDLFVEAITSFSEKPLKFLFYIGLFITIASLAAITFQLIRKIISPELILQGFTSLYILILFSLGVIISAIGLVAIYISKIFNETKSRPLYVIKKKIK